MAAAKNTKRPAKKKPTKKKPAKKRKPPKKPARPKTRHNRRAEQRVLKFVNAARIPEDLTVLPHDVQVVDEAAAHLGDVPLHAESKRILDLDRADRVLHARHEDQREDLNEKVRLGKQRSPGALKINSLCRAGTINCQWPALEVAATND